MNQMNFIALLEVQINQEIIRLKNAPLINKEQEQTRLTIYQQLIQII